MATASMFRIKSQTKSISLPSRSHPTTFEIEELLNKTKTMVAEATSAEAICSGLSQLTRLHKCMDGVLTSSTTQVLMSRQENKIWVEGLVLESVKFLDICGSSSDMLAEIKNHSKDLICALRRRKGDSTVENSIMKYNCFQKKMKRDVKSLIGNLKQIGTTIIGGSVVIDSDNHQLLAVIKAVIGVSDITVSVFESLLILISSPVVKQNRWSRAVSKLRQKAKVACEDQQEQGNMNDFEGIDDVLRILGKYGSLSEVESLKIAQSRLERLGARIEGMESGLECMFRCLVQTRVSLLNIISK